MVGVIALVMMGVVSMLSAGSAQAETIVPASAADCEGGANGFVDIPDTLEGNGTNGETVIVPNPNNPAGGQAFVSLRQGTVQGKQRGWALITGNTLSGERVWMDWRRPNVNGWLQCGPFTVNTDSFWKTSAAMYTTSDPNWQFRACGDAPNPSGSGHIFAGCTDWW
jgi:hypothetical protein